MYFMTKIIIINEIQDEIKSDVGKPVDGKILKTPVIKEMSTTEDVEKKPYTVEEIEITTKEKITKKVKRPKEKEIKEEKTPEVIEMVPDLIPEFKKKPEKLKALKLEPMKVERNEIKPQKLIITKKDEAPVNLAEIKLKKPKAPQRKEAKSAKLPRFLLKSRITPVDFPPAGQEFKTPIVTTLEPVFRENGIISRNVQDADKELKKKRKKFKVDKTDVTLETLDIDDEIKRPQLEKVDDEYKYKKPAKPEKKKEEEELKPLVITKGIIPETIEESDNVKLKKIPKKEDTIFEDVIKKPKKDKPKPIKDTEKKESEGQILEPFKAYDIPSTEVELEKLEIPEQPTSEKPKSIEEIPRKVKPKKPTEPQGVEQIVIIKGTPKPKEEPDEDDISLRYKQKDKPEEEPEPIKLKPFKKDKDKTEKTKKKDRDMKLDKIPSTEGDSETFMIKSEILDDTPEFKPEEISSYELPAPTDISIIEIKPTEEPKVKKVKKVAVTPKTEEVADVITFEDATAYDQPRPSEISVTEIVEEIKPKLVEEEVIEKKVIKRKIKKPKEDEKQEPIIQMKGERMVIERKIITPQILEIKNVEAVVNFAEIKLKKAKSVEKKPIKESKVPKFLLKSRIKHVEFPSQSESLQKPLTKDLAPAVKDYGILSRNMTDAVKIKKPKRKVPDKSEDLQKLDVEFEELKQKELEKVDDVYRKPTKEKPKKIKPVPKYDTASLISYPIERNEIKPQKMVITKSEDVVNLATIQLKKAKTPSKKDAKSVKLPKFMLKSRITHIDFPPLSELEKKPIITICTPSEKINAILSRNIEEAEEVKKTKRRKLKDKGKSEENLEVLDLGLDEYKRPELEKVDEQYKYQKKPKDKPTPEESKEVTIKLGKGKIPEIQEIEDVVKLKKIPTKPIEAEEEKPLKKVKDVEKPKEPELKEKPERKIEAPKLEPFNLEREEGEMEKLELPSPEIEEPIQEEISTKRPSKKKKPLPEPETVSIELVKGKPKPTEPEEEAEIKLKYKQGPKPEEPEEVIKLKPFTKPKDAEELQKEAAPVFEIAEVIPKSRPEEVEIRTIVSKKKVKKPKDKETPAEEIETVKIIEEEKIPEEPKEDLPEIKALEPKKTLEKVAPEEPKEEKPKKIKPEKVKLEPIKIERKEVRSQKVVVTEPETVNLATIKLKKPKVQERKEPKDSKVPKFLLKSRIVHVIFPPVNEAHTIPIVKVLEPVVKDNGIISRNLEEAEKQIKKPKRKLKKIEKGLSDLEKLDLEMEELKAKELEKVDDEYKYKRQEKKPKEVEEDEIKITLGKGKIPKEEVIEETISLKKIPQKPKEEVEEDTTKIVTIKKKKPEVKPVEEEETESITLKKKPEIAYAEEPEDTLRVAKHPEVIESIDVTKKIEKKKKKIPKEEVVEEIVTLKPIEEPIEEVEETVVQLKPKIIEEEVIEEEIKIKKKPKAAVEEAAEEMVIKIQPITKTTEIAEIEEEITLKKKPKKEKPVEEVEESITLKPITKQEEVVQEIKLKKKPIVEEVSEEAVIQIQPKQEDVVETVEIQEEVVLKRKSRKPKEERTEEIEESITLKSKIIPQITEDDEVVGELKIKKQKPKVIEEVAEAATIKIQPEVEQEIIEEEEIQEQIILKRKPKAKPVVEEIEEEAIIKKPKKPEEIETTEVTLKPKKKKPQITEDVSEEITIQKKQPMVIEETVETESTIIKKSKKPKKTIDESAAEITITKEIEVLAEPEVVEEEIVEEQEIKLKPKVKPSIKEEPEEVIKIAKPQKEEKPVDAEEVTIKKTKKPKKEADEVAAEVTIKKIIEQEPEQEETIETTITRKPKPKKPTVEEIETEDVELKLVKPKLTEETEITENVEIKKKKKVKTTIDEAPAELTIKRPAVVEDTVEEFTVQKKKKPPPFKPAYEEHSQEVTIKKLKPMKKRVEIPEYTEVENVTFRPKSTKTKEDVEQEFKISLDEYAEEEISMSGKVKLRAKPKPLTYSEEAGQETIRIKKEIDEEGPTIEEIIDDGSDAEELPYDEEDFEESFHVPFKRRVKPRYSIQDEDEISIDLSLSKQYQSIDYKEQSQLTLKSKRRESQPTFDQEAASLSISKKLGVYDEEEEEEVEINEGDIVYSKCLYIAEADQAMNLVEGEKLYILDTDNDDWWFVKKYLAEEKGWVPAQILMDEASYNQYVQRKLYDRIDRIPVFEKPKTPEKSIAPRFIEKLQPQHTPDGYTVQFECQVEGVPRPQITWFKQSCILKPSEDFQMFYDEDNVATLIINEVFPEDAGTFTCVAKNSAGFASSTTELFVEAPLSDHGTSDTYGLSRRSMSRESSLADIVEGIPPTFSKKPRGQCVKENNNLTLECSLIAIPEPDITWLVNGKPIKFKNSTVKTTSDMYSYKTVLSISKMTKVQEGVFEVRARNREGESAVKIVVKVKTENKEAPQIIEPLKDVHVFDNEPIRLTTAITGNPKPEVTWYKNGEPIVNPEVENNGDEYVFTIRKSTVKDTAEYTVKAKNTAGTVETSARIFVTEKSVDKLEPPIFIERFQEQIVQEKSQIRLSARVSGNPTPEVSWIKNSTILKSTTRVKTSYDGERIELVIADANPDKDNGHYICTATNSVGKTSHGSRVTVDVDAKFTKRLEKKYQSVEHESLILECETSHAVSTKWYHDEVEITGMDHRVLVEDGKVHRLYFDSVTIKDIGQYKCIFKNQETSTTVIMEAKRPEFTKRLQDLEITEKQCTILEVEVSSDTAEVTWRKEGKEVDESTNRFTVEKDGGVRRLIIRSTSIHDEGEYTCVLVDEECSADVTVIELPPEIISRLEDVTINKGEKAVFDVELTKGDALVSWFKDDEEIQFSEHIQLSIDGKKQKLKIYNSTVEDIGEYSCQVGTQRSRASLTVIEPTLSFIRKLPEVSKAKETVDLEMEVELSRASVKTKWSCGGAVIKQSSKYKLITEERVHKLIVKKMTQEDQVEYTCAAEDISCTTKVIIEAPPSPPRGPLEISGMSDTSFTLQWVSCESDGGSTIIEYIVEMRENVKGSTFRTIGTTKGDVTSIAATNLEKGCGYFFKITARNAIGVSKPYCPEEEIVAGSRRTPPSPPTNLTVTETTSRSASIKWSPPLNDGGSRVTGYVIEKRLESMTKWEKVVTLESCSLSYTLENLKEKSNYLFRVFAENSVGLSVPAMTEDVVQLRTHATVPSPPTAPLEIRTIGPNAVVVEWGVPEFDGGAPIEGYNIALRDVRKTMWMEIGRVSKGVLKFTVRDLQEDHDYRVRIFARNEIGLSDPLESEEPVKILPGTELDQDESFREVTDREPTSYSVSEPTSSWMRDNNMDADIYSYAKGRLLRRDEYFFKIWCYAKQLFK